MPFDATDLEIARREHASEMGEISRAEWIWHAWVRQCEARLTELGWDHKFTGGPRAGQSRGLDGSEREDGYSLDYAHDAFSAGISVEAYIKKVQSKRSELGL